MTKKLTVGLILATIAIWIGWDVFVAIEPTPGDTESEVLRDWGWRAPSFVFALGALLGHWFGNADALVALRERFPWSPVLLAGIGAAVVGADVAGWLTDLHPMVALLAGIPAGAVLWPLRPKPSDRVEADG